MPVEFTAGEAARSIAPKIGKCSNTDKEDVLEILSMAQSIMWRKGKYRGFYKEGSVNTSGDYLVMPSGWGSLLGVNINTRPAVIRGRSWEWHQNGAGSISECQDCDNGWTNDVIDAGEVAVPREPCCESIMVRPRGCEDEGKVIKITGLSCDGEAVYTFEGEDADTIYGEKLELKLDQFTRTSCLFREIQGITKDVTKNPVDIYYFQEGRDAEFLMTMQPHQKFSRLRRYRLPSVCGNCKCVHILAKIDKPEDLTHYDQPIIAADMVALSYFAMHVDYDFYKKDSNMAEIYLAKGIRALEEELVEHRGQPVQSIQLIGPQFDMNKQPPRI